MSFLSGLGGGNLFNIAESAALGAVTGGAGLAVELAAQQVLKSAVGEGLQLVGQQLGLSQGDISSVLEQTGFGGGSSAADTASAIGQQLGFTPFEQGSISGTAQQATDAITQMMQQGVAEASQGSEHSGAAHGKGGMSVLQAIAYAMGKSMDDKLNDMADKAQQLGNSQSGSSQYGQLSSEIQADGQELSMLSSAVANAIKSIGEAGSTLAKKD